MKIKKLVIYGYGKWIDQTFDLNEDIQIFLGENEAGKSTLMSFIHSIFFGFPTRNSILLRY
ncbi:MAG: AAA family ATPase, partial [Atopostipes suicloacalis]|nr:AAA family ATPase [Atopostipes suicloacalis]